MRLFAREEPLVADESPETVETLVAVEPPPTEPQHRGLIAEAEADLERADAAEHAQAADFRLALDAERALVREQRDAASRRDSATTADAALAALREFEGIDRRLTEARSVRQALERALEAPKAAATAARQRVASLRAEAAQCRQAQLRQMQFVNGRRQDLADRERMAESARESVAEAEAELERLQRRQVELTGEGES